VNLKFVLIGLLALLLGGCAALRPQPEPPIVSLAGIQMREMTLFEQRYQLQLRLQNPNDMALPITGLHCRLFINEREFAQGVSAAAVDVPRFGEALLAVDMVSDLRRVFEQLRDTGSWQAGMVSYRLSGKVAVKGRSLMLPFEYRGEFDLGAMP
jgi:LEA14-like dessication related protein